MAKEKKWLKITKIKTGKSRYCNLDQVRLLNFNSNGTKVTLVFPDSFAKPTGGSNTSNHSSENIVEINLKKEAMEMTSFEDIFKLK